MKILFRDYLKQPELIQDFKFPKKQYKPKILPSKQQLKTFYTALPEKYKLIFLMLASSGLRISELLNADINKRNRMLVPKPHDGQTKNSWISFYSSECDELLNRHYPFNVKKAVVAHTFKKTANKTGIDIKPQTLRSIFAHEMGKAGIQDRYIDAFCGRTPQSVLARHYSDFSPDMLREIYIRANIKILN